MQVEQTRDGSTVNVYSLNCQQCSYGLAAGPDGNLWFVGAPNIVGHIATDGSNLVKFSEPDAMADGEVVSGDGFVFEGVTTPGHTANHMAFALKGTDILFAGDHVMGWSTTIVAPPDGAMTDYMDSLNKLARRSETVYFPGHGGAVAEAPRFVAGLILHRKAREASILHRLGKGETDIATIVRAVYIGLDPRLTKAAGFSVLAHMEDLVARGAVATDGAPSINGVFRLA